MFQELLKGTRRSNVTAGDLHKALKAKHPPEKWIYIPECKTGPTHTGPRHRIMDAWALRKSWQQETSVAYEIKVSRQDFMRDEKWTHYLDFCNEFYFVVPPGVCDPSEVSEPAGLMVSTKNGTKLFTKRKAPRRQIPVTNIYPVLLYILFWRSLITDERYHQDKAEMWRAWLAHKAENRELGYEVSRAIREKAEGVQKMNDALKADMKQYDELKEFLFANGVDEATLRRKGVWRIKADFKELRRESELGLPDGMLMTIQRAINDLETLKKIAQRVQGEGNEKERREPGPAGGYPRY